MPVTYVWGAAMNCFSGPVSFVNLFAQPHRGEFASDTEQGAAGDGLVIRPLPESSPQLSAGYDLLQFK